MSNTVDQRIVEMRFNNEHFQENVSESLSTIDKLQESLKFTGAAKGLENIESASKNCRFSSLSNAVESIQMKFSALEIMAVTALTNITNSAINTGKKMVAAFTIDPVKSGFQEYETQINAVQTILANTSHAGTDLDQVNAALDELNVYADKTIYNFTEMTRNIGTFTAAGVDLDTSVGAIKGIANLAAVSGSTSQQASTAMYQLSQALAAGRVSLQDWNSVVNAGMGGKVFQDALMNTAEAMGIAVDRSVSFRESISAIGGKQSWLTSEVLLNTLNQFTGDLSEAELAAMGFNEAQIDSIVKMAETANNAATKVKTFTQLFDTLKEATQSGWTQSWEIIIGDFEEAQSLLTGISDKFGEMINKSSEARNNILSEGLNSGWTQFLSKGIVDEEGFKESILSVAKEHNVAVDEMITEETSFEESLKEGWLTADILAESLTNLTDKTRGLSDEEINALGYTREQIDALEGLEESVKNGSISLEEFSQKMALASGRENLIEAFGNAFEGIASVAKPIKEAFNEIFPPMTGEKLYELTKRLEELTAKFKLSGEVSENLKNTFKGLFTIFDMGGQAVSTLFKAASPLLLVFGKLSGYVLSLTGDFGVWLTELNAAIKEQGLFADGIKKFESFTSVADRIGERLANIKDSTGDLRSYLVSIGDVMKSVLDKAGKAVSNLAHIITDKLSNIQFDNVVDVLNVGFMAGIAVTIRNFLKSVTEDFSGIKDMFGNIPDILDGVRGSFEAYQTNLKAGTLLKIASAIAILAGSLVVLSLIDSEKLMVSIVAITTLFAELMTSMAIFSNIEGSIKGAITAIPMMVTVSASLLILAVALKKIAELDEDAIIRGVAGLAGISAVLVLSVKALSDNEKKVIKGATSMLAFSVAIKILAGVCEDLSKLNWEQLATGLTGVGALLAMVDIFLNTAKFSSGAMSTAVGILILSAALKVLAGVCEDFGTMDWEVVKQGLISVGILLGEIVLFSNLNGKANNLLSTGVSLIAIAAAMKIFASAVGDFGAMSWEEIGKGLVAMATSLLTVIAAVKLMPEKEILSSSVGLIVIAGALKILASALGDFGAMSWEEIAKGLAALGGSLGLIAIGLNLMNGTLAGSTALMFASVAILALTPALTALGSMSVGEVIISLVALAGAFAVIGGAAALLTPVIPSILGLSAAIALIGGGIMLAGAGMVALGAGLTSVAMGLSSVGNLIKDSSEIVSQVAEVIITFIDEFLRILADKLPSIVESGIDLIVGFLSAISSRIGDIIEVAVELIVNFINGITDNLPLIVEAGFNLIITFLNSLADGLRDNSELLGDTIANVFTAILEAAVNIILSFGSKFIEEGKNIVLKLIDGIGSLIESVKTAASNIMDEIKSAISEKISELFNAGRDVVDGFLNGISSALSSIWEKGKELGNNFLNGAREALDTHSPSKETEILGKYSVEGFINGVDGAIPELEKTVTDAMIKAVLNPMKESIDEISENTLFGSKAADKLAESYSNLMEKISDTSDIRKADILIYEFGKTLYKESEQYKTDTENIEEHRQELAKLVIQRSVLQKQLEEQSKKGTSESKKKVKEIKKDLEDLEKSISDAYDTIKSDEESMVEHMKETYSELRDAISGTIKDATDPLKSSLDTQVELLQSGLDAQIDLFDKFELDTEVTSESILENMRSQIKGVSEWRDDIENLTKKGLDNGLINNLIEMGTSGAGYVKAFLSMSEKEIENANYNFQRSTLLSNKITTKQILANMKAQVAGVIEWNDNLNSLSQKGFASGLIEELKEMGVSGASYVKTFMSMTEEEMQMANASFKASSRLTAQTLLSNFETSLKTTKEWVENINKLASTELDKGIIQALGNMGVSSAEYVNAFLSMTAEEIKKFNSDYAEYLTLPEDAADSLIASFVLSGQDASGSLENVLGSAMENTNLNASEKATEIGTNVVTNLGTAIDNGSENLSETATNVGMAVYDGINEYVSDSRGYTLGRQICDGLIAGLQSGKSIVTSMARQVAYEAYLAACEELGINSPSKMFEKIGEYSIAGFVNGLSKNMSKAVHTAKDVGKYAISGLANTISYISEMFSEDFDYEPTIRPVMDLSSVENGVERVNELFLNAEKIRLNTFNARAANISGEIEATSASRSKNVVPENRTSIFNFEQNNYSPKALSRVDIYRQTKNQISMLKGAVAYK